MNQVVFPAKESQLYYSIEGKSQPKAQIGSLLTEDFQGIFGAALLWFEIMSVLYSQAALAEFDV